jgi:hypothetical protein
MSTYKLEVAVFNPTAFTVGGHAGIRLTGGDGTKTVYGFFPYKLTTEAAGIASTLGGSTSSILGSTSFPEALAIAGSAEGVLQACAAFFSEYGIRGASSIVADTGGAYVSGVQAAAVLWHTNESILSRTMDAEEWSTYDKAQAAQAVLAQQAIESGTEIPPPPQVFSNLLVDGIELSELNRPGF